MVIVTDKCNVQRQITVRLNPASPQKDSAVSTLSCGFLRIFKTAHENAHPDKRRRIAEPNRVGDPALAGQQPGKSGRGGNLLREVREIQTARGAANQFTGLILYPQ
jgi:hypothetical protein